MEEKRKKGGRNKKTRKEMELFQECEMKPKSS